MYVIIKYEWVLFVLKYILFFVLLYLGYWVVWGWVLFEELGYFCC